MNFTVQVHNAEDGGLWAEVEEIPGCITQADSAEELEANLKVVIEQALVGLIQDYVDSLSARVDIEPGDSRWTVSLKIERERSKARG